MSTTLPFIDPLGERQEDTMLAHVSLAAEAATGTVNTGTIIGGVLGYVIAA